MHCPRRMTGECHSRFLGNTGVGEQRRKAVAQRVERQRVDVATLLRAVANHVLFNARTRYQSAVFLRERIYLALRETSKQKRVIALWRRQQQQIIFERWMN